MISLRSANENELNTFNALDHEEHARRFVLQTGLEQHRKNFLDPNIYYLRIEDDAGDFCGYFILVQEPHTESVEFRRVIIARNKRGIGQLAIVEMESFCRSELNAKRIWLDVFEDNEIGIYIYEKRGYTRFKEEPFGDRKLYFYEKDL